MRTTPEAVHTVGIIGAGVIGGGWALHFLRLGKTVLVYDPSESAGEHLRETAQNTWPTLKRIGLAPGACLENLHLVSSLEALNEAEMVQENAPEDLEKKQALYQELDTALDWDVPVVSSTSGFAMTDMQKNCRSAARTCVGHPFNPPYIVPFVEVVGGEKTDPETVRWTEAFYTASEKKVIAMQRELPGFIANRLQEALWREALHMVAEGEATPEEIDASIVYGPGLRWAFHGPCMTFHLAGGEGGMAHMLEHFEPALKEPWTRLEAPELSDTLRERMVQGCERQTAGRSIAEVVQERDECLIRVMQALQEIQPTNPIAQKDAYASCS